MAELTETVYEHASGENTFTITAAERWSVAMAHRLKREYPDEVQIMATNNDGSMVVHFPFDWMRIIPKKRITLSEERKEQLREQLRARNGSADEQ